MEDEELRVSPIAGWETMYDTENGIGIVRLLYYASPMERFEQAHSSPRFAFQPDELRKLAAALTTLAGQLEAAPPSGSEAPKH